MKKIITTAMMLSSVVALAQHEGKVGINTQTPMATIDLNPSTDNAIETAKTNEGILIPRLSKTRVANIDDDNLTTGTLVYINNDDYTQDPANPKVENINGVGFFYYDGNAWQSFQRVVPKFEYILSNDGSVLVQWMDKYKENAEIDMNNYPDMKNVKTIEASILYGAKLKKFIVREGVKTIGGSAFSNTNTEVILPNSIEEIKAGAFSHNTKVGAVSLPNLKILESNAFDASSITSIDAPLLTEVGRAAFARAENLTSVNLPQVKIIRESAFTNTPITSINLHNVITMGGSAFNNTLLTEINLPNIVTIGSSVFHASTDLTNITIGPYIETIGNNAFNGISQNNPTITIQASTPPTFGSNVFSYYSSPNKLTIKVPPASVNAYKTALSGKISGNYEIVGY